MLVGDEGLFTAPVGVTKVCSGKKAAIYVGILSHSRTCEAMREKVKLKGAGR